MAGSAAAAGQGPVQSFEANTESKIYVVLNSALKGAAHLANLLPTGSYSLFLILAPLVSNHGQCHEGPVRRGLVIGLLAVCFVLCLVSCFTDSFKTLDGTVYYGLITVRGLWTPQLSKPIAMCPKYMLKGRDIVHCVLVLFVFSTVSLLNDNVITCLYNRRLHSAVSLGVPPLVGFLASVFFIFVPSERHGIGYPVVETEAVQAAADIAASIHSQNGEEAGTADKVPADNVQDMSNAKLLPI